MIVRAWWMAWVLLAAVTVRSNADVLITEFMAINDTMLTAVLGLPTGTYKENYVGHPLEQHQQLGFGRFTGSLILMWKAVFIDPLERRSAIGDDLLAPDDPDHRTSTVRIRRQLAPAGRCDKDLAVLAHRVHAADSIIRAGAHAPHLRPLRLHVHLHQPWTDRIVAS